MCPLTSPLGRTTGDTCHTVWGLVLTTVQWGPFLIYHVHMDHWTSQHQHTWTTWQVDIQVAGLSGRLDIWMSRLLDSLTPTFHVIQSYACFQYTLPEQVTVCPQPICSWKQHFIFYWSVQPSWNYYTKAVCSDNAISRIPSLSIPEFPYSGTHLNNFTRNHTGNKCLYFFSSLYLMYFVHFMYICTVFYILYKIKSINQTS